MDSKLHLQNENDQQRVRPLLTLRFQLAFAVVVLFGLLLLAVTAIAVKRLEASFLEEIRKQQESNVHAVALSIQREAHERLQALTTLSQGLALDAWSDATKVQAYLEQRSLALNYFSRDVYVISPEGVRIAEIPLRKGVGQDYRNSSYVQRVLETKAPVVTPLIGRYSGQPNLIFAMPVLDAAGNVRAILCGSESLTPGSHFYLSEFIKNGESGGYHVFDFRNDVHVASTEADRVLQPLPGPGINPLFDRRKNEGYVAFDRTINSKGQDVFSVGEALPEFGWLVLAYIPADEVLRPVKSLTSAFWLGASGGMLLLGILVWWLMRRKLAPLEAAAQQMAGYREGGPVPQLPEVGSLEIQILMRHLNQVHRLLQSQFEALKKERDELDIKVAERTRELAEQGQFIRAVTDAVPGMVGYWDAELRNRFANAAYLKWFGKSPEQLLGTHIRDLLGDDLFELNRPFMTAALSGEFQQFERVLTTIDGQETVTWAQYFPHFVAGRVVGFVVLVTDVTQLKQTESKLIAQAKELESLYQEAPCGYHSLDQDGIVRRINDTELRWLGYDREEVIGRPLSDFMTPATKALFGANYPQFHAQGHISDLEFEFVRKDGSIIHGLIAAKAEYDKEGKFVLTRSVVQDYSTLYAHQQTLREILSRAPIGAHIVAFDDGRTLFINQTLCDMLGIALKEAMGGHFGVGLFYADPAMHEEISTKVRAGEPVVGRLIEFRTLAPDSRLPVWVLGTFMPITYEGRDAKLAWYYDVSDLRSSQASLAEAQRLGHMGSWRLDLATNAVTWSEELYRMFGADPAKPPPDLMEQASIYEPESWDRVMAAVTHTVQTGLPYEIELQIRRPDGSSGWIMARGERICDVSGKAVAMQGVAADITLRKEAELLLAQAKREAEEATKAKSMFLANMSHEIRSPMNAVLGFAHLLKRTSLDAGQSSFLDKLGAAGEHLLAIINDILDLSKIEAGKFSLEEIDFSLNAVFDGVRSLIGQQAAAKGLAIEFDFDGVPQWLRGDPTRLRQAMLNYASNAVKFTEQGKVVLASRLIQEEGTRFLVRFEVADTGIGIPAHRQKSLFTAFQQVDASTTRRYGGTGLGLAITERIARLMGGEVGVESVEGRGCTFWFTAWLDRGQPLTRGQSNNVINAEAEIRRLHAGKAILLVDDDPINQEVALMLLAETGLLITTANNGIEAIDRASSQEFALILMDMQMPEMDGLKASRQILKVPGRERIPILAMTANAYDEDRRQCLAAGMVDFISKPIDPEILFAIVLKWL